MKSEQEQIKLRYQERDSKEIRPLTLKEAMFKYNLTCERERIYFKRISGHFGDQISRIKFLEIGAGFGYNLHFMKRMGIPGSNIWANDLMENRLEVLERSFPEINIIPGDALTIKEDQMFNLILFSTVFSSILNSGLRRDLASKALKLLEEDGVIIIYDFIYNNPRNQDVKCLKKREIKDLFKDAGKIEFRAATLAPPIGRKAGNTYNIINSIFPFLRTHVISLIYK